MFNHLKFILGLKLKVVWILWRNFSVSRKCQYQLLAAQVTLGIPAALAVRRLCISLRDLSGAFIGTQKCHSKTLPFNEAFALQRTSLDEVAVKLCTWSSSDLKSLGLVPDVARPNFLTSLTLGRQPWLRYCIGCVGDCVISVWNQHLIACLWKFIFPSGKKCWYFKHFNCSCLFFYFLLWYKNSVWFILSLTGRRSSFILAA